MNRRRKYRIFVLMALCMDLVAIAFLGYRYLDRKIPDEVYVRRGQEAQVTELLGSPLVEFEEAITASHEQSYVLPCKLFGVIPFKEVKVTPETPQEVCVSGNTVGIYMETEGVLIVDTGEIISREGESQEPSKNIVKPGDYIVAFNNHKVTNKKELMKDLEELKSESVTLELNREGETIPVSVTPAKDRKGEYKLGLWVRDDTQGIGTLTFVDGNGRYGALGHGISDVDTAKLLNIHKGALYKAEVLSVTKGRKGSPGELAGLIRYEPRNILGSITANTKKGIYGRYYCAETDGISLRPLPVAYKQEAKIGPASILCSIDGEVKEYAAEITRIDLNHEDTNKSFVIHITDPDLLRKTGGIVQGMSGSPIIQNGRLIGAVTHVFVQDSTSGYGIFIENMLDAAEKNNDRG